MDNWKKALEFAILEKLDNAATEFSDSEVQILDIGVFPWHEALELSLLLSTRYS